MAQASEPVPPEEEGGESKPFLDHLEDLRKCLVRIVVALGVGMLIATPLSPAIMRLIARPLEQAAGTADPFLRSLDVTGAFSLWMRVSVWAGIILSLPVVVHAIASFVFPGLTPREKKVIRRYGGFSVLLFAFGVYLGYRALPMGLKAMMAIHQWMRIRAEWTITSYVPFAMQVLLAFGIVFEMPVVLLILGRLGLIQTDFLREKRRHVYVLIFIVAAILTPPEVVSQLIMSFALIGLYELCIWMLVAAERRDRKKCAEPPPAS
jgi:sec-independent protein translocase protein TatC